MPFYFINYVLKEILIPEKNLKQTELLMIKKRKKRKKRKEEKKKDHLSSLFHFQGSLCFYCNTKPLKPRSLHIVNTF